MTSNFLKQLSLFLSAWCITAVAQQPTFSSTVAAPSTLYLAPIAPTNASAPFFQNRTLPHLASPWLTPTMAALGLCSIVGMRVALWTANHLLNKSVLLAANTLMGLPTFF